MSRKYKFHNAEGMYFVSFATVEWVDLFIREVYFEFLTESLKFCIENRGLLLYAWCIMPSHMHLVFGCYERHPGKVLGEMKTYTSKALQKQILQGYGESRREWLLKLFSEAGSKRSNVSFLQIWQQDSLWSPKVIDQKIDYIHMNPVVSGFVEEPHYWKHRSAVDYNGGTGVLKLADY